MTPVPKLKDKFSKERFSVGLDIGTQSIKVVKLKFIQEQVQLCGFDLETSPPDVIEFLKRIKESLKLETVNISVCGPSTVIRYVNFPKMKKDELQQALKFEAPKHIPFSIDEINLDAYILNEDLPDNKMLILLAAVKKELIDQRLKLMEDAGLRVNLIDIDSLALVNSFNFNYPLDDNLRHKVIALLNIGASTSNLDISEDGIPRLSRDIHIAGNSFTQKLADILGIDFKAAENLKLSPVEGMSSDSERANKVAAGVESVLGNLANEIRISFDYYESQSASSVAKIFLTGGSSVFRGLKDILANLLGIEVEYWDPLKQITLADNIDSGKVKALSSQLSVAVGLALR